MTRTSLDAPRLSWRNGARRAIGIMVVTTLATGAAGCGGSSKDSTTAPPKQDIPGAYVLETIQTQSLPAKIFDGPIGNPRNNDYYRSFVVTVKAGQIDLDDYGNYRAVFLYNVVANGEPSDGVLVKNGTYRVNGNRIALTTDDGVDAGAGTIRTGEITISMTIVDEGKAMTWVFRQ
jgi:hypothetical protein